MIRALRSLIRGTLRRLRFRSDQVGRYASRFNRVGRYGWDMVLWSHLLGRKRDPIPVEFPPGLLAEKGVKWQPPVLHVSGDPDRVAVWDEGFAAVNANLLLNLQPPDILSKTRYAHPAPAFRGVYLWDSAFIAQIWRHWDIEVACDINRAVLELSDQGRLQHVVADFVESKYTQPPVMAWSQLRCIANHPTATAEVLEQAYPILTDYHDWLCTNRRLENGLFAWAHPYESGIDNSPRFSSQDESQFADTTAMASPDFSAYMVLQAESLAEMARRLERGDEARRYDQFAEQLRTSVNQQLWHEEDGLYYDLDTATAELLPHKTIASLIPLWAGIPTEKQLHRMKEHIFDTQAFNTRVPLPSVARDAPSFVKDMWRGPVWINTAYTVVMGLERYGCYEEAGDLAFRLCEGVYRTFGNCRRVFEFYDPERFDIEELLRKQGNLWKRVTLGSKPVTEFVGWSGLVNSMVLELLVGFGHRNGVCTLRPLLPRSAAGLAFSVRLPMEGLAITVERDSNDRLLGVVRSASEVQRFDMAYGEELDLDSFLDSATRSPNDSLGRATNTSTPPKRATTNGAEL